MRVYNHGSCGEFLAILASPSQRPRGPWLLARSQPVRFGDGRAQETEL